MECVISVTGLTTSARMPSPRNDSAHRSRASRTERVIIVEDNRDTAELMGETLAAMGHDVNVAHDALQALTLIARARPTVMVLDIGLPVMDGYELATRIREAFGENAPRLIAVTGRGLDQDRARSREIGFEAHLVKPLDLEALLAAIAPSSPA